VISYKLENVSGPVYAEMLDKALATAKNWSYGIFELLVKGAIAFLLAIIVIRFIRKLFSKQIGNKKKAINVRYVENMIRIVVIGVALFWVISSSSVTATLGKTLFQGTALIGAVAGFAAQPILSDLFCGLMLSMQKPFEIGDRIELEDGTAGIVKDISIRHVVLQELDTVEMIIPNSKLNAMKIRNLSKGEARRSFVFEIGISFNSDIKKALEVIFNAVKDSPYTVPGKAGENGKIYAPVYFLKYDPSALILKTTVYFEPKSPTEVVKSDVNRRVKEALDANGIEIPYPYVNVVQRGD